jgi:hypothetical protein
MSNAGTNASTLDDDEHGQVAGRVRLHDLDFRLAAAEEPRQGLQRRI